MMGTQRYPGFNKGSVNWLKTEKWMRNWDSTLWLFKSAFWLPDLEFFLLYWSSNTPVSCPTISLLETSWSNSHCHISQQDKSFWLLALPAAIFRRYFLLVKCCHMASATLRVHHAFWNQGTHLNCGTLWSYRICWISTLWGAGKAVGHWTFLATMHCQSLAGEANGTWKKNLFLLKCSSSDLYRLS